MLKLTHFTIAFAALVLAFAGTAPEASAGDGKSPIVVELFTSQGCSSCPPAEAYLGELAKRSGVLALELHVDYWDYIGWKDPFADRNNVERQRLYGGKLGSRYVYTPQMVINGRVDAVGSDRDKVEDAIKAVGDIPPRGPQVTLSRDGDTVRVKIGGTDRTGVYDVFFVTYDAEHSTEIMRGENRGKTLVNTNIVRNMKNIGHWVGKPTEIDVSIAGLKGDGGCAVLIQQQGAGPILAAASLPFSGN